MLRNPFFFLFIFLFWVQEAFPRGAPLEKGIPEKMTGEWGGGRTLLRDHGVKFDSSFVTDLVGNPIGGEHRGFAYSGSYGLALTVDFQTACNIPGLKFYTDLTWRTGTSLSRKKIGNQFPVQQNYGSQTIKLNELYLKETLFRDDALILKIGRLDAGNDFLQNALYYYFVNNAFDGNPISVFFNTQFTAYPNSTWGAYLSITPIHWLEMKFAVYNANSEISLNKYHGVNFTFQSTNGVIWITQWDFHVDTSYPGSYRLGFLYQTGDAQEFKNGFVHGNPCFYLLLDQMIYRPKSIKGIERGLIPFVTLLFQPENRNLFPFFTTAGMVYKGPFSSRPKDALVWGLAYGRYSKALADMQRTSKNSGLLGPFGNTPQSYEAVIELNYWIQVNEWCTVVPDIQYILNPSGYGTIPNALVLGAQIGIVL